MMSAPLARCIRTVSSIWVLLLPGKISLREICPLRAMFVGRTAISFTPGAWEETLDLFLRRVKGTPLRWFLYGSGALAVRGIDVQPGDLDFCVNDAHLAGGIFDDLLVEPVTTMTGWIADCGARAFAGCLFE